MSMRRRHSRQTSVDYPRYPPLNWTTQQPPSFEYMPTSTHLQTVMPSDYESDNQGYVSDYPVAYPPTTRSTDELNFSVVRRHNPEVVHILSVAPYATIYEWAHSPGESKGEWQKSGQIGTLFICQLTDGEYGESRYHAIVLNRGGLDNFNAELRQSEQGRIEVSGDFVIITNEPKEPGKEPKLNAIYIFSEEGKSTANSRAANGELMVVLAESAKKSREAAVHQFQTQNLPKQENDYGHLQPAYQAPAQQPSPAPQVAPQPHRPANELLSLFQGHQPRNNHQPVPIHQQQAQPPQTADLYDLFRRAGVA